MEVGSSNNLNKISVNNHYKIQNSVEVLSKIGLMIGILIGTGGLALALTASLWGLSTQLYNTGFMLTFFSLVLLLLGTPNLNKQRSLKK